MLFLLLIWISEGSRNLPTKSYRTNTEQENGPLVFSGFPWSDFEHPLLFSRCNRGKGKVRSRWQGQRSKMEEGSVTLSSTTFLHARHRWSQALHLTSVLCDCLFRSLFSSQRLLLDCCHSLFGQPQVLPGSTYFTVINNRKSLELFSTQVRWVGFTSKVKQNESEPRKLDLKDNWRRRISFLHNFIWTLRTFVDMAKLPLK